MRTTRTFSNVSYNSIAFFESKIKDLANRGILDWAYWILHKPESDETKEHIHFICRPSSRIDTAKFRELLFEFVSGEELPRTCTKKFELTNSMDDWLLYAVHDTAYLRSKGEARKFQYTFDDLKATDRDALREDWHKINRNKYYVLEWLESAVASQIPFYTLVQNGQVPITQRAQYEFQYNALWNALWNEEHDLTGRKKEHDDI